MKRAHSIILASFLCFCGNLAFAADNDNNGKTYILGHWNHPKNSVQPVYVMSEGDDVELLINGISYGHGRHATDYLFIFDDVIFQPGILTAVGYDWQGNELSRHSIESAGVPAQLKLTPVENRDLIPNGNDFALILVEVGDFQGKRCGGDNRVINFEIEGPAEWLGSFPHHPDNSQYTKKFRVENGANRALIKSTDEPGQIKITAKSEGLDPVTITLNSRAGE